MVFEKEISLLNKVFPQQVSQVKRVLAGFPLWVTQTAEIVVLSFNKTQHLKLALINPKKELEYSQLTALQRLVATKLKMPALIVGDKVNPKFRSLFVRNNVPYIFKEESIYAPEIGIVLNSQRSAPLTYKRPIPSVEQILGPFELKLIAGYLTDHLQLENFNLQELSRRLENLDYHCSMGKLSGSILKLIHMGFLEIRGQGPNRIVNFLPKQNVWLTLSQCHLKKLHTLVAGEEYLKGMDTIWGGESALSIHTNLVNPKIETYAITNKQFFEIKRNGDAVGNFGQPTIYYDIRKEDPWLFSINDALNPIELYFDFQHSPDERVQIALSELLNPFGLEVIKNV
ncbi:MAG: hypothetical protein KDD33_12950 [Bdellovibrionales bacterium]|nr:hypothetical protein [Bdellovibrionales bacterium]